MNGETAQTNPSKNTQQTSPTWKEVLLGFTFSLVVAVFSEFVLGLTFSWIDTTTSLGRVVAVMLTLFMIHRFSKNSLKSFQDLSTRNLAVLAFILLSTVAVACVGQIISHATTAYINQSRLLLDIQPQSFIFAIPWCFGILILQAILGLEFAFVACVCLTIITGVYLSNPQVMIPYVFCTSITAAVSLAKFRSRSAYIKAGLHVALISIPLTIISLLLSHDVSAIDFGLRIFAGCASGIIGAFLAAGFIPLFEHFGRYVTDLRLIELATLDHPLLKDLSIQAPGTWNHSMVMGMMAESAADAVGANPVIARVGAYFHDIGKSKKPLYFVENQSTEENRHDKLSPSMSALIIRSHVKDGLEMAKKHQLPLVIQDMIPQHHGTSVIEYFYDKALKEVKEQGLDANDVDKSLYTYPGPKPQTKEAGLLMLADAIEAAARTLPEPTADRIQGMVQKLINKIFASGQLNECPLTLQELHRIAKSFTRVLTGIYHHRIAYAEPAEKTKETTDPVDGAASTKKASVQGETGKSEKPSEEDLKRLGIGD